MGAQNHPLPEAKAWGGSDPFAAQTGTYLAWGLDDTLVQEVDLAPDAPRVIGLCGAAQAGKSTVATMLVRAGYERLAFADPIKAMLYSLLAGAGVAPDQIRRMLHGDLKGVRHEALDGQTPRHAMQTLGTEWGRDQISPDLWVRIARRRIRSILARGGRVVVEDVRMPNEARLVWDQRDPETGQRAPGEVWLLTGRGGLQAAAGGDHESENLGCFTPDFFLDNGGCLDHLETQILERLLG